MVKSGILDVVVLSNHSFSLCCINCTWSSPVTASHYAVLIIRGLLLLLSQVEVIYVWIKSIE